MISRTVSLLSIVIFLLFIIAVVFIVLYVTTLSKRIDPQNCPQIKSTYAVVPNVNTTGLKIISQCSGLADGTSGSSQCSFSGVNSLYSAINICNSYPNNLCSEFYYDETNTQFSIIQSGFPVTTTTTQLNFGDVYIRQT